MENQFLASGLPISAPPFVPSSKKNFNTLWAYLASLLVHGILLLLLFFLLRSLPSGQSDYVSVEILPPTPEKLEGEKIFTKDVPTRPLPKKIGDLDQGQNQEQKKDQVLKNQMPPAAPNHPPTNTTQKLNAQENPPKKMITYDPADFYLPQNLPPIVNQVQEIPEEIKQELEKQSAKNSGQNNLNYALSDYQWSYKTYVEQWAKKIITWWRAPTDYIAGKVPNGGSLWIKTKIDRSGKLLAFEVYKSEVTPEMQRKALQALISSFDIPPLPKDFPQTINFYWQFIYPEFGVRFDAKKEKN